MTSISQQSRKDKLTPTHCFIGYENRASGAERLVSGEKSGAVSGTPPGQMLKQVQHDM